MQKQKARQINWHVVMGVGDKLYQNGSVWTKPANWNDEEDQLIVLTRGED